MTWYTLREYKQGKAVKLLFRRRYSNTEKVGDAFDYE